MIDGLHFLRPYWLWLLPVTGLLLWWILRHRQGDTAWRSLCDPQLLAAQLQGGGGRGFWLSWSILGGVWLLSILALAGPSWQQQEVPVYNRLESRLILFDLSRSMDSNDLTPSRLVHARFKLNDLVQGAGARQQGLLVFAGDAFVVSPLTDDQETLLNLIPGLSTDTVPVQGSRTDKALELAGDIIRNAGVSNVQVVLITDGVDARSRQPAVALADRGHQLNIIGVGTAEGAPVALADGGLLKDSQGNIVVPGVDHQAMAELARHGNGRYFDLATDGSDVQWLNRPASPSGIPANNVNNAVKGSSATLQWLDNGSWLLLPLVLLASYGFRRGVLLILLIGLLPPGQEAMAFGWNDLWQRPDQQAYQAMQADRPGTVPQKAPSAWRGAAAYRQQDFGQASELFDGDDSAQGLYNRGNALANNGRLEAAVDAWQKALERNPEMDDARHNRDLVQSLLDQRASRQAAEKPRKDQDRDRGDRNSQDEEESPQSANESGQHTGRPENGNHKSDSNQKDKSNMENQDESESGFEKDQKPTTPVPDPGQQNSVAESGPISEDQQSLQQWLNQVPDDPGGLLRRKFRYQYSQRRNRTVEAEPW